MTKTKKAFKIVIDLANQNSLDPDRCDPELWEQAKEQEQALRVACKYLKERGLL